MSFLIEFCLKKTFFIQNVLLESIFVFFSIYLIGYVFGKLCWRHFRDFLLLDVALVSQCAKYEINSPNWMDICVAFQNLHRVCTNPFYQQKCIRWPHMRGNCKVPFHWHECLVACTKAECQLSFELLGAPAWRFHNAFGLCDLLLKVIHLNQR